MNAKSKIAILQAFFGLLLLPLFLYCSYQGSNNQEINGLTENSWELESWDEPPQPIGGYKQLQKNLIYPEFARKDGVAGKVVVEVIFNDEGQIEDMKVIESVSHDCDKEALRAIHSMRWKPATQKGIPVPAVISIPISFTLQKMHSEN
jgi:protein TonB